MTTIYTKKHYYDERRLGRCGGVECRTTGHADVLRCRISETTVQIKKVPIMFMIVGLPIQSSTYRHFVLLFYLFNNIYVVSLCNNIIIRCLIVLQIKYIYLILR